MIKTYSELISFDNFSDRLNYLRITKLIGDATFGFDRYINQNFYRSKEWKDVRNFVIARDNGCDLGISDRPIAGKILVHHINPITINDIDESSDFLMNPEYLICCSTDTHNNIHYGYERPNQNGTPERKPNDTCPWR